METKKEKTKSLKITVDAKFYYEGIDNFGCNKLVSCLKERAAGVINLIEQEYKDNSHKRQLFWNDFYPIAEFLGHISGMEDSPNLDLKHNYEYLDDFIGTHDPWYMKSLLADIMCDYGNAVISGTDKDIQTFVDNASSFNSLNKFISSIVKE